MFRVTRHLASLKATILESRKLTVGNKGNRKAGLTCRGELLGYGGGWGLVARVSSIVRLVLDDCEN